MMNRPHILNGSAIGAGVAKIPIIAARQSLYYALYYIAIDARETTMKMLSVRLDDEESAALQAICAQTGMTKTEVVKAGIMTLAKGQIKRKSAYELAEQMGLVGGFDGPEDLAENAGKYAKELVREKHHPH